MYVYLGCEFLTLASSGIHLLLISFSLIYGQKSQLRTECSQEIDKVKQKYDLLLQEQDSTHLQQTKTLDNLCEKVLLNQSLAYNLPKEFISFEKKVLSMTISNHFCMSSK